MKRFLIIALLGQFLSGCSSKDKPTYNFIKILTVTDADSGTFYNKGAGLNWYLYYNPNTDSVVFRKIEAVFEDSVQFATYEGQFENQHYADTIAMLIAFLEKHKSENLSYVPEDVMYCGPEFLVEYNDGVQSYFRSFILSNYDTLNQFEKFFYKLEQMPWDKKFTSNNRINVEEEVVHSLKGVGTYDSIVFTPPYIPLPCEKGIKMEMLYGTWRTRGDKYNNANLKYTKNTIDKDGSWVMERFSNGELKPLFSAKIISISKDHVIKLRSKYGPALMKVLNLTKNCFEYIPVGADSNQIWRFDKMK